VDDTLPGFSIDIGVHPFTRVVHDRVGDLFNSSGIEGRGDTGFISPGINPDPLSFVLYPDCCQPVQNVSSVTGLHPLVTEPCRNSDGTTECHEEMGLPKAEGMTGSKDLRGAPDQSGLTGINRVADPVPDKGIETGYLFFFVIDCMNQFTRPGPDEWVGTGDQG